ncbi:TlpA disulfide reductase family protein [Mucilaginibacter sp.]|uniref:peroxiredoxin family protein n=1 Tax=Mucilaginibacter sp. TaxID=1882438 RepID=UPI002ED2D9DD
MTIPSIKTFKASVCIAFAMYSGNVSAQATLVQKTIDKIDHYKNFSYRHTNKIKDFFTTDTSSGQTRNFILKAPENNALGYLYRTETLSKAGDLIRTELYNGKNRIGLNPSDSTYRIGEFKTYAVLNLLVDLNWINDFVKKKPYAITSAADTTIDGAICSHLIINSRDTIVNKEHLYTRLHLFIDKVSDMPVCITRNARSAEIGNTITNYYSEDHYFDYKFDQDLGVADLIIPKGFHEEKNEPQLELLTQGTVAPDLVLDGVDGKKIILSKFRGKVVLLDYFFIGCYYCMLSVKPLNNIQEKYKNQNVAIASMTERDSKSAIVKFRKINNLKYPIYVNRGDAVKSYHVSGFPTFYIIDKEGKIANVFSGYDDNFEEKVTSVIDKLLK